METSVGIIIRTRKLTETSLIVTWCTSDSGVLKTVAKGARKGRKGYSQNLDLFAEAELVWMRSRSSELHRLSEFSINDLRQPIRENYGRMVLASYFCEVVERAVEPECQIPEIYDLLKRALNYLKKEGELKKAVPHFEKEMADCLGLGKESCYQVRLQEMLQGGFPRSRQEVFKVIG